MNASINKFVYQQYIVYNLVVVYSVWYKMQIGYTCVAFWGAMEKLQRRAVANFSTLN